LPEPYLRYKEHKEGDEEEEEDDENEDADDGDDEEGIDGGDGGDAKRRKGRRKRRGSNYMADGDDVCSHPLNRNTAFSLDCKDKPYVCIQTSMRHMCACVILCGAVCKGRRSSLVYVLYSAIGRVPTAESNLYPALARLHIAGSVGIGATVVVQPEA